MSSPGSGVYGWLKGGEGMSANLTRGLSPNSNGNGRMSAMAASQVGFMPTVESRLVLIAGFGGLLILMALAGADGIQALQQFQTSNDRMRYHLSLQKQVLN